MHNATLLNRCITLSLNMFIVVKAKFFVTYDVIFTVNVPWSEVIKLRMADAKLHYFF